MTREEKLALYYEAKQAYYESSPIMGDSEFDALEEELGLQNKSIIGAGSTPNYTIKHPFIMGSLSKVQIKATDSGTINWFKFAEEIFPYLKKVDTELPLFHVLLLQSMMVVLLNIIITMEKSEYQREVMAILERILRSILKRSVLNSITI